MCKDSWSLLHHLDSRTKKKGKRKLENFVDNSMVEIKAIKKPKQPNSEHQEIVSLVQTK